MTLSDKDTDGYISLDKTNLYFRGRKKGLLLEGVIFCPRKHSGEAKGGGISARKEEKSPRE